MIGRPGLLEALRAALRRSPVAALLGPRQCGKTTLARLLARQGCADYFDLEDASDLARLDSPHLALSPAKGLVILDEVQRKPDLFEALRVLVDRPRNPARFLLLGSASPGLVRGVSETLAGRIAFVEMGGFHLTEVGIRKLTTLWLRGGFPRSFLAPSEPRSLAWREDFIRTFLERDLRELGIGVPSPTLRRFWTMVAHYHGQIWNAAEFARSLGSSEPTARRYLDLLEGAFVVRRLLPWHENLPKRQVCAPKVYVRDTGILHGLLGIRTPRELARHPKYGTSWEGFALEQVLDLLRPREAYFWATHAGAELDLLTFRGGRRLGFEFTCADAPRMTRSMHVALADLDLNQLYVIYPGEKRYRLAPRAEALPLARLDSIAGG